MSYFSDNTNNSHMNMFAGRTTYAKNQPFQSGTVYARHNVNEQSFNNPLTQLEGAVAPPHPIHYSREHYTAGKRASFYYVGNSETPFW